MNTSKILWVMVGIVAAGLVGVFSYVLGTKQDVQTQIGQNTQVKTEQIKLNNGAEENVEETQTTAAAKDWKKYVPAIRAKQNVSLGRADPSGDSKIVKEEFKDITKDGIPEFFMTSVVGRVEETQVFYLADSSYMPIRIEQWGNVGEMVMTASFGGVAGFSNEYFLPNGDLCRYGYEYQSGTNESQFTWNSARQLFVETAIAKECKDRAFEGYKSFVFPDQQPPIEKMNITVYVQDKARVLRETCGATNPLIIEVPKTTAVADASLRYLFIGELAKYGAYESVKIENGVAKVFIYEKMSGYGSCEVESLRTPIEKTLMQYPAIQKVELYRANGETKIEF